MLDPTAAPASELAAPAPAFVEAPARRHWWSPAPAPELPPISAKRAYGEVLFVFSAFFLTGVIEAGVLLANRYKNVLNQGSWALYTPQAVEVILQSAVAVVLVLLLCSRRGVSTTALGLRLPRRVDGRFAAGATTRIFAWAIFAQVAGAIPNALLQTGHLPTSKPSAPELIFGVAASAQAGVVEEIVVLAFVVVGLRQARRPLWEITVVALVLRGSYHIYYGPGVVGILLWAALFYWIYLRTQALIPLMVAHAAWDTVGFLSQRWASVAVVAFLVAVALWIAAPITWAVEKGDRDRAVRVAWSPAGAWGGGGWGAGGGGGWGVGAGGGGGGSWVGSGGGSWAGSAGTGSGSPAGAWIPPGWHPDPSGVHYWRWWDGYRWTDHVSGP